MLEAGRALTDADYKEHVPASSLPYRNRADEVIRRTRPKQKDCYACREWNYDWFANDIDEPYTTPDDKPFAWMGRMRVVGGRTNVWGRQSYRLGDIDFKAASRDGHGVDWPLSYADLAPYYDIVDEYVGITGINEGADAVVPDGRFHPPMGMSCIEHAVRRRLRTQFGRTMTLGRSANLTRPINGRSACHYCGPCEQGCATHSYFNSAFTTVADALRTGRTTLVTGAMVHQVIVDPATGKARGVSYIDRSTRQVREVYARVVVMAAQALESTRILLNSREGGLANGSGVLGKYLMDHISGGGASAEFPDLAGTVMGPDSPRRPNGIYLMRFRNLPGQPAAKDFLRGYGYQGGGSTGLRGNAPGFGAAYKATVRDTATTFNFGGFGECLPYADNEVSIDRDVVDTWGIPAARVHAVARQPTRPAPRHGLAGRRDARRPGRHAHPNPPQRAASARLWYPRSRHGPHGPGREVVGAQSVPAGARGEEPVCHRRRRLPVDRLPEPDPDDHGADRAVVRLHTRRNEKGEPVR
ncbi:Paromamine 6'-oxidase [Luteitalea pratensis]|uniref:Paromamine 6'-oxidase n=1 Tax=Luteitalea pratensis TaxID=1855912 RepID=A0A143PRN4_LUTPR|nr:GMC family oxidoreductase N-terminal domain-containing protein [Luteitalea pratensis]AMY10479.1 Paromamine 6'-oxidase [Luteitalea pratensis]